MFHVCHIYLNPIFSPNLLLTRSINLACSITLFWSGGNISSPVRYSYISIFPDDSADTFAASLLISSLPLSSIVIISFYILSKKFLVKQEVLSYAKVASITKKKILFAVHFFI